MQHTWGGKASGALVACTGLWPRRRGAVGAAGLGRPRRSRSQAWAPATAAVVAGAGGTAAAGTAEGASSGGGLRDGLDAEEACAIVERCLPRFPAAGLPELEASQLREACARPVARLWGGMGSVFEITVTTTTGSTVTIVAKRIKLPHRCTSVSDKRKKDSYDVEAAFYRNGHAEQLICAGCRVPFPLFVENSRGDGLTICMSKLEGKAGWMDELQTKAVMSWLAGLHATFWGRRADEAVAAGLQPQGCYWYLDTRAEEHERMPSGGWEGRLRLAARAIDLRLKADPMQSVCHGDAKDANIFFADGEGALVYDFQYCGKAPPTKDLAYTLTCASNVPSSEEALLRHYHSELSRRLEAQGDEPPTMEALRTALALSYCDLGRWMSGWGWWGNPIDDKIIAVLDRLDGGTALQSEQEYMDAVQREFPA